MMSIQCSSNSVDSAFERTTANENGWRRAAGGGRRADSGISQAEFMTIKILEFCCGWESLMKSVTLGNVTMSHRTREARRCLASLSHSTMIGLPRAQH
ncbi:hypothetical protein EVAR_18798_1 [Eumeta japonica]|uniref:Uncharacterized protein n=1 Tax=Eumeta variegata TaxID=151549 RepID=A0A4C1ULM6_EUMVA|nr:hypothetical protein EVAR_18798_1 [Eumeta japonica]